MINVIKMLTREQEKDYVIIDHNLAEAQLKARTLALMADAFEVWINHVQGVFIRESTLVRYMESLYIDITDPLHVFISVEDGTLAEVLEFGQKKFNMSHPDAAKGASGDISSARNKVRPIDDGLNGATGRIYNGKARPYKSVAAAALLDLNKGVDPTDIASVISGNLHKFSRQNAWPSFKPKSTFQEIKGSVNFRVQKPEDVWKHPGINERRALASRAVHDWISANKETYTQGMFEGEEIYDVEW